VDATERPESEVANEIMERLLIWKETTMLRAKGAS